MPEIKRIGIITSGGDCGGLNAVIKGAAHIAIANGIEPVIIPNGYAGLYNLIDSSGPIVLDLKKIDSISSMKAGSEAGHTRVKIGKIDNPEKYKRIKEGLDKFGINALVIAGGDDTGSVVVDLIDNGISCIHVPKTMDLDLHTYSVGGDSSINRIANYIDEVKTTGRSHNRVMILEVFGRYAGHTTFRGGIAGEADCILIPEVAVDFDVVYEHLKKVFKRRIRESEYRTGTYVIVVNEGLKDETGSSTADLSVAVDSFGHKKLGGSGKYVREQLAERLKNDPEIEDFFKEMGLYVKGMNFIPEVRESVPGYLTRSGYSSALDVNFGKDAGAAAVMLLLKGIQGVTVTGLADGNAKYMPIKKSIEQRFVSLEMVSVYEQMDICFGRVPKPYATNPEEVDSAWCYL